MKNYLKRLHGHPGIPVVIILTFLFVIAGLKNNNLSSINGIFLGLFVSSFFWILVLFNNKD